MDRKREVRIFLALVAALVAAWWMPVGDARFDGAVRASLELVRSYAREHVILCLVPALWIAGGIAAFVRKASVLAHLGPQASKVKAYGVASVSGTILAVCSCTILPLFAGIHRMGAGLGPAVTLLYAGPAINVLAIVLTARVLGPEMGLARAVGAVAFSVVIGLAMQRCFRREARAPTAPAMPLDDEPSPRSLGKTAAFFGAWVTVLVFVNWGAPRGDTGLWAAVYAAKWWIAGTAAMILAGILYRWMGLDRRLLVATSVAVALAALVVPAHPEVAVLVGCAGLVACTAGRGGETGEWFEQSWGYAKQIVPLLLAGVLVAGLLLGTPDREGGSPRRGSAMRWAARGCARASSPRSRARSCTSRPSPRCRSSRVSSRAAWAEGRRSRCCSPALRSACRASSSSTRSSGCARRSPTPASSSCRPPSRAGRSGPSRDPELPMTTLQILGTGCPKCVALTAVTEQAARALGLAYRLEKVTSIAEITRMGVMLTPALVVDGVVKCAGRVPTLDQVRAMLAPPLDGPAARPPTP